MARDREGEKDDCWREAWPVECEDHEGRKGEEEGERAREEGGIEGGGEGARWGGGEGAVEVGTLIVIVTVVAGPG